MSTVEGTVVKIGRIYVTVSIGNIERQFHISTGIEKTEYSPDYRVWESMQAFEDHQEAKTLSIEIRNILNNDNKVSLLSLNALKQIKAILDD